MQNTRLAALDHDLGPEIDMLRNSVRDFADEKIAPIAAEIDKNDRFPIELWPEMGALGLHGITVEEEYGGAGMGYLAHCVAMEEVSRASASVGLSYGAHSNLCVNQIRRNGSPAQKAKWLKPLLNGEIRSAYAMTEPNVASSDAKNISTTAKLVGDEWVINGEKYYISGLGDPRCKIMIVMVKTSPDAPPSKQQSQILVPKDTPGVEILGPMHVFGHDHAPRGHMHLRFNNVRVPKDNMLLGEGRGFEISQVRLGPGRIHHCMRTIGKAEKALDMMVSRGLTREAFGKKIAHLGGNLQIIAQARCEIEAMRLMVLKAAKAMDVLGNKEARIWVSMVKAMVPERACKIIDQAIQMHGATGISQWTPLAEMYTDVRHLRFADGPDEVHWMVVGRHELSMP